MTANRNTDRGRTSRPAILALVVVFLVSELALMPLDSSPALARFAFGAGRSFSFSRGFTYRGSFHRSGISRSTWDRNGGGIFRIGPSSSSGYEKPSLQKTLPRGGSYREPVGRPGTGSYGATRPPLQNEVTRPGFSKPSTQQGASSSGYVKPSLGTASPSAKGSERSQGKSAQSSGYSKPSLKTSNQEPVSSAGKNASGGRGQPIIGRPSQQKLTSRTGFSPEALNQERKKKAQESLLRYKSENARFQKPAPKLEPGAYESNPLYQKARTYSGFDYGSHYDRRDAYYKSQGYQPPPQAFSMAPRFGIFDTLFLFWMLNHVSNKNVAAMAYNHADDPEFVKWRQEVESLAKDNPDLKAKLDDMDKQVKAFQGTPKDPGYLPKGVPPEVALAADVLATKKPDKPPLRFAAGEAGGWYDKYGTLFKKDAGAIDVSLVPTQGSKENLKLLVGGKADLAIIQSDVLAFAEKILPGSKLVSEQSTLYPEYVQLIANRNGGIQSLRDLRPRNVLYVGPTDSGSALTWHSFCELDPRYRRIPIRYADYNTALAEVERNPKALMLFVGGLNSEFLKKAEEHAKKTGTLRLVTVDEPRFASKRDQHGNRIYRLITISSSIYPALQKGWIFSGDVKTLAVDAVLVLRTGWARQYGPEATDSLSRAILETRSEIRKMVNQTG